VQAVVEVEVITMPLQVLVVQVVVVAATIAFGLMLIF
jgi:hypothetical protein